MDMSGPEVVYYADEKTAIAKAKEFGHGAPVKVYEYLVAIPFKILIPVKQLNGMLPDKHVEQTVDYNDCGFIFEDEPFPKELDEVEVHLTEGRTYWKVIKEI